MGTRLRKVVTRVTIMLIIAFITILLKHHVERGEEVPSEQEIRLDDLLSTLDDYNPPFSALLIDVRVLEGSQEHHRSNSKIKVAISTQHSGAVRREDFSKYHIVYYDKPVGKNYLRFFDTETRIIPRINFTTYKNFLVPIDIKRFVEFWKRSELRNCIGLEVMRSKVTPFLPKERTLETMSSLMTHLISFDIFPFLNGGTLLGWLRECDIIPHTTDVDFAAFVEEYNPKLLIELRSSRAKFHLKRTLGKVNDSYEFTLGPLDNGRPAMDLFWMYHAANESWVGGTGGDGSKYKYSYPRIRKICAGDLLGHIFWVPCNPLAVVSAEYGPKWYKDLDTKNFLWKSSHYNMRKNGKFPQSELKEVYSDIL